MMAAMRPPTPSHRGMFGEAVQESPTITVSSARLVESMLARLDEKEAIIREQADRIGRLEAELAVARLSWWRRLFTT